MTGARIECYSIACNQQCWWLSRTAGAVADDLAQIRKGLAQTMPCGLLRLLRPQQISQSATPVWTVVLDGKEDQ